MAPAGILLGILALQGTIRAQASENLRIVPVRGSIYLLAGAGANITVSAGPQGLLLVDTGLPGNGSRVLSAVVELNRSIALAGKPDPGGNAAPMPISFILNTNARADHVGGNAEIAGSSHPEVYAYETVLQRMSDDKRPAEGFPSITFSEPSIKLSRWFNGDGVELLHMSAATTNGDSVVEFRSSDVLSTGDIFDLTRYPPIDISQGGTIQGVISALNRLLDLTLPDQNEQGGTLLIPGHGRICDAFDLAQYRNMVTIIRDRVAAMAAKGMTLEQVQKAKPTEDWDPQFGKDPVWTPARFVEAVYKTLNVDPSHAQN